MANRFCMKCGSAAADGQRFCKVCGQSLPQAADPVATPPPALETPVVPIFRPAQEPWAGIPSPGLDTSTALIVTTCSKCNTVLMPDQRSCWVCGQPVAGAPVSEPAPAIAAPATAASWEEVPLPPPAAIEAMPAPTVCSKCQTVLTPDQRSCWVCGQPVGSPSDYQNLPAPSPSSNAAGSATAAWASVADSTPPPPPAYTPPPPAYTPSSDYAAAPLITCANCHAILTPDQKFCRLCGQPTQAKSPAVTTEPRPVDALDSRWIDPAPAARYTPAAVPSYTDPSPGRYEAPTPAAPPPSYEPILKSAASPNADSFTGMWAEVAPAVETPAPPPTYAQELATVLVPVAPTVPPPVPEPVLESLPEPVLEPVASDSPAQQVCAKCLSPMAEGQKFCRICGHAVDAVFDPEPKAETPVTIPAVSALSFPDPVPAVSPEVTPMVPAVSPVPIKCRTCKTVLTADQKFCWVCGQVVALEVAKQPETMAEMGAPTHTYKEVAVAIPERTDTNPTSPKPLPPIPLAPPPVFASNPPVPPPSQYFDLPAPPATHAPEVKKQSNAGLWILLTALFLAAAGAGGWLYIRGGMHPATPIAAAPAPQTTPAPVPPPDPQPSSTASTSTPATLPLPATDPSQAPSPLADTSQPLPPPATSTPTEPVAPAAPPKKPQASTSHAPASTLATAATPKFSPPPQAVPPLDPMPAAKPTSGTLRYSGPPVSQNGVVVFDNLPAGRLRFDFDHSLWRPTITRNPDGTQKLVLHSSVSGQQQQCVVQWTMVQ